MGTVIVDSQLTSEAKVFEKGGAFAANGQLQMRSRVQTAGLRVVTPLSPPLALGQEKTRQEHRATVVAQCLQSSPEGGGGL